MGFADSVAVKQALDNAGIVQSGWKWQWNPGQGGGVFEPHQEMNQNHALMVEPPFDVEPGADVNGGSCMCQVVPVWREKATGRFARVSISDE